MITLSTTTARLALNSLHKRRRLVAFDANVQRRYGIGTPHAVSSLEEHDALGAAIDEIETALRGGTKP